MGVKAQTLNPSGSQMLLMGGLDVAPPLVFFPPPSPPQPFPTMGTA